MFLPYLGPNSFYVFSAEKNQLITLSDTNLFDDVASNMTYYRVPTVPKASENDIFFIGSKWQSLKTIKTFLKYLKSQQKAVAFFPSENNSFLLYTH